VLIEQTTVAALVAITSLAAYALGTGTLHLERRRLIAASLFTLQIVGMSTLFLLANVALGLMAVLVVRGATGAFVSVYVLNDYTLCALSALQGACFECWRAGRPGPSR
jgi:hypothetical protein